MSASADLHRLTKLLLAVRADLDDDCSLQKLLTLVTIASAGPCGIDQQTLIHRARLSRSNASKLVADLSNLTSKKKPGPDFVRSETDPMNLRTRLIRLTPKGIAFLDRLFAPGPKLSVVGSEQ